MKTRGKYEYIKEEYEEKEMKNINITIAISILLWGLVIADVGTTLLDMKKIMFPVMGIVFGVIWIILAFIGARLPHDIILIIIGLIDGLFGIFLIFLPVTTFLGLFYIAVGALTITVARHSWGGDRGIDFLLALTLIIFLLTGGLTFVAYDSGVGRDYFSRIALYIPGCDADMNIARAPGDNYSDRCGNYALFIAFSVFLLFLVQPIALLHAAFKRVGHQSQNVTVEVNEKHHKKHHDNK